MKRWTIIILLVILTFTSWGCAPSKVNTDNPPPANQTGDRPSTPVQPDPVSVGQSRESLGGLRLGMTSVEVESILGRTFVARWEEAGGPFREAFTVRTYADDCDVVIGSTSGKVLQIDVYAAKLPTELGVKVGDNSISALQKYREKYPEFVGNQSPAILPGWFVTEPGTLLVFSSMENRERNNRNISADSKIHAITLGYSQFFD